MLSERFGGKMHAEGTRCFSVVWAIALITWKAYCLIEQCRENHSEIHKYFKFQGVLFVYAGWHSNLCNMLHLHRMCKSYINIG